MPLDKMSRWLLAALIWLAAIIITDKFVVPIPVLAEPRPTAVRPRVTATPLPMFTPSPTPGALTPLERVLRQLSTDWYCYKPTFEQHQDGAATVYSLHCPVAAVDTIRIMLVQYETEEQTRRAFKPIPIIVSTTTFHGFRAAAGITMKTEYETTECLMIQARQTLITIYSTYELNNGAHADYVAETVFKVAVKLGLKDFFPL